MERVFDCGTNNFLCSDFLFEAIKTEREGTVRHYLEAAEALALSPVDFFHASNFSIKFAANVLLSTLKERESRGGASGYREEFNSRFNFIDKDDDAVRCPHLGVELKSNKGANIGTFLCALRTTTSIPLAFPVVTALGAPFECNDCYFVSPGDTVLAIWSVPSSIKLCGAKTEVCCCCSEMPGES